MSEERVVRAGKTPPIVSLLLVFPETGTFQLLSGVVASQKRSLGEVLVVSCVLFMGSTCHGRLCLLVPVVWSKRSSERSVARSLPHMRRLMLRMKESGVFSQGVRCCCLLVFSDVGRCFS